MSAAKSAAARARAEAFNAERLEDLTWMANTGETASRAAERLGCTLTALKAWCRRQDCSYLYHRLRANEVGAGAGARTGRLTGAA